MPITSSCCISINYGRLVPLSGETMIILYNILQLSALAILWPFLLLYCLTIPKYRVKLGGQTGLNTSFPPARKAGCKRVWIHALSVGEVTSALPLVREIRRQMPDTEICFSANTTSGRKIAHRLLDDMVDYFLFSPIDVWPVVSYFQYKIKPDLYIQVETDFWPNQLAELKRRRIPSILVNGRISAKSFNSYSRFSFFFEPLFKSFHTLCMQRETDRQRMISLGVPPEKVLTLGNLKYDVLAENDHSWTKPAPFINDHQEQLIWVAGSTHSGEEEILFTTFRQLITRFPSLKLILAPRNIERAEALVTLAAQFGFKAILRSSGQPASTNVLILDTLGELVDMYSLAVVAFVGGSLVKLGGHNPIEPASQGAVTLFGSHMDDFSEISAAMISAKAALQVKDGQELTECILSLLADDQMHKTFSSNAFTFISSQHGVVDKHIQLIRNLL